MGTRRNWTRLELLLALGLYLDPALGRRDEKNDSINNLALRIGRRPSSVVYKLANFQYCDQTVKGGFSKGGQATRELWDDLLRNPEGVERDISEAWEGENSGKSGGSHSTASLAPGTEQQTEAISTRKSRRGQDIFRRVVLNAYRNRCCVTGVGDTRLLVASHIKPWRDDKENRLNPTNGLCLNVLHDKAFDIGLITVGEDYRIKVSSILKDKDEDFLNLNLVSYEGVSIGLPQTHQPSQEFLAHHRQHIFTP